MNTKHKCPTKIYSFYFSKLMSTPGINCCFRARLGGEPGGAARQRLMSWLSSTRSAGGQTAAAALPCVLDVLRLPESLARHSVAGKPCLLRSRPCASVDSPRRAVTRSRSRSISISRRPPALLAFSSKNSTHDFSFMGCLLPIPSRTGKQPLSSFPLPYFYPEC